MSPRPKKRRNCKCPHRLPGTQLFKPAGIPTRDLDKIQLMFDELEALRLCDGIGLSQAEAGENMGVSRGTVQRLVTSGRKKVVKAIVECQGLIIVEEDELA